MADHAQPAFVASGQSAKPAVARELPPAAAAKHWSLGLRVCFRFCVAYFTLFCLSNQIVGGLLMIPKLDLPGIGGSWPLRQVTLWTAHHIFRVSGDLVYIDNGSGDKAFDWVLSFCLLIIAALITGAWSLLDRRRQNYVTFHKWFRVAVRFALASEMFFYGLVKIIPMQMPFPYLTRLLEPYGNFSPMGVLWSSVGASAAYEIFTGAAETFGGILLLTPRTTTLGALVCLADTIQVFTLNMTYDVPVKLFSFHLLLFALFLLAPEARRLFDFFLAGRPTPASTQAPLFESRRRNRIAFALQVVFGVYLIGMGIYSGIGFWHEFGSGRPKSSLYGIWNVESMTIDGQVHPPLLTDQDRWRRVIFDFTTATTFQRMDDTFARYGSSISDTAKTIALTKPDDKNWKAILSFTRPAPEQLALEGTVDGHKIQMQLKLQDRSKFLLVNRGFHWINEVPFNR